MDSFFSLFGSLFLFSKIHKNTQAQGGSKIGRQELLFCAPFQLPACDTALHVPQTAARPPRTLFVRMRVDRETEETPVPA